jgi:hypothetical protein
MNTSSTTETSRPSSSEPRERDNRPDPTVRDAFTDSMRRAEGRSPRQAPQDHDPRAAAESLQGAGEWAAQRAPLASLATEDEILSVAAFAHSLAQPFAQPVDATPTPQAPPTLSLHEFAAALDKLVAPASQNGVQQWEFMLAHGHGALAGVQVTAQANVPLRVTLKAHGRDREALESNLGDLGSRLRARHAQVGDVLIDDAQG